MTVIPFPTPQLKLDVRKLRRSEELVDIGIRFRCHDDPADVEEVRWNIQGNIQRRGGIPRAKGFKLRECALARTWFEFTLKPEQLPRFVHEILPYVDAGNVIVEIGDQRLSCDGIGVRRA